MPSLISYWNFGLIPSCKFLPWAQSPLTESQDSVVGGGKHVTLSRYCLFVTHSLLLLASPECPGQRLRQRHGVDRAWQACGGGFLAGQRPSGHCCAFFGRSRLDGLTVLSMLPEELCRLPLCWAVLVGGLSQDGSSLTPSCSVHLESMIMRLP